MNSSRIFPTAPRGNFSQKSYSPMIDCHCHLVDKKFKNDVEEVISKAQAAGIQKAVVLPEYPSQFEAVLELRKRHPEFVIAGIGVHPIQKRNKSVRLDHILAVEGMLASHQEKIGCIGEVGLDFTTDLFKVSDEDRLVQERVFRQHIQWAREYDLALNCHSRTAEEDTIRILMDEGCPRALLHAYGGPVELAVRAAEAGLFFSIPPCFSITEKGRSLVEALPLPQLVLETDSPVLGVEKGVRNEPTNCLISAEFIAEVKGIPLEEVKQATTQNAKRLFKL